MPWRHVGKIQYNGLVFFFIMTHLRKHEIQFASKMVMRLDVMALNDVFMQMTSSHKASVKNYKNTAGKQFRCDNPFI